jgi:glutamate dehydrogenase
VAPYFPAGVRQDMGDLIPDHRLYRQLVATDVAGEIVDQMGIVWAHDLASELGRPLADVAAAFWVARQVTGAGDLWAELEHLAGDPAHKLSAMAETTLQEAVAAAVGIRTRVYLSEPGRLIPGEMAARDTELLTEGPEMPPPGGPERAQWAGLELPDSVAEQFLQAGRRVYWLSTVTIARATGRTPAETAEVADALDRVTGVPAALIAVGAVAEAIPPPGRLRMWQARAILDDLAEWRRSAIRSVLTASYYSSPAATVEEWAGAHADVLARAAAVAPGHGAAGDVLASATLMLRRLRQAAA